MAGARREGVAPAVGLEPTTKRLTAARSTTELRRSEGPIRPRGPTVAGRPGPRRAPDSVAGSHELTRDLVSVEGLAANLHDPRLRIVDVRWYLNKPGEGRRAY